ncbi:MAG: antitoxin family protein [Nitrospirae bacterium]|uniref:antitoxin family protein n=1 Tax=Candidatus Magnetobacterium casense TaxID=1455061 RepID=UPI00058BB669|nr:antitoxin family protein [Candidatus Magnetobacterium casensis]MBF0337384.1 antitoxin family protein [Nitrospirota bacterium]
MSATIKAKYFQGGFIPLEKVEFQDNEELIIMSRAEYLELLEDLEDLAAIEQRKDDPLLSMEEAERQLKPDGLL